MTTQFTTAEIEAYLDEALPAEAMVRIELAARTDAAVRERLAAVVGRRDQGLHSLGAIWRRARVSCPTRDQLGSLLLAALPEETARYVALHVETVGCRYCQANLADLTAQRAESRDDAQGRRKRYFRSSVGFLQRR